MSNYNKNNFDDFDVNDMDAIEEIFSSKGKPPVKKTDDMEAINEIFSNKNKTKHNDMAEIRQMNAKRNRIPNRKINSEKINFDVNYDFENENYTENEPKKSLDDYGDDFDFQTGDSQKNINKSNSKIGSSRVSDETIVFDKNSYNDDFTVYSDYYKKNTPKYDTLPNKTDNYKNLRNNNRNISSDNTNNENVKSNNTKLYALVVVLSVIILILALALVFSNCKKPTLEPEVKESSTFATKQRITVPVPSTQSEYNDYNENYYEGTQPQTQYYEVETTEETTYTLPPTTQPQIVTQPPTEFVTEAETTIAPIIEEPTEEYTEFVTYAEETTEQIV